ncbi:N/A [soil metagenome]
MGSTSPAPLPDPPAVEPPGVTLDHGWATARGPRSDNQDRAATTPGWLVVSDGIGGHAGGATAASLTVAAVADVLEGRAHRGAILSAEELVVASVAAANRAVRAGRRADPTVADMGATIVLAVADGPGAGGSDWKLASVGDSPAWVVSAAGATQVTADDNVAGELVRSGTITPEDAEHHPGRHLLVRAVGLEDDLPVAATTVHLRPGDALVLASDGLSGVLGPADIHGVLSTAGSMAEATATLVERSLLAGTRDNVTVAAVRHLPS